MKLQKFVAEVRYVPQPDFIDIRGHVVKKMTSRDFGKWRVSKDRIDVFGDKGLVFVSYTNLGFVTFKKKNIGACIERVDEFLKITNELPPLRWGIRIYTISESNKDFAVLVKDYKDKLLNFKPEKFNKVGGELEDLGVSYIFKNDKDKYHISTGPMKKEQATEIFPGEELPERGIFIDLDIYRDGVDFYKDDFRRARIKSYIEGMLPRGTEIIDQMLRTLR